VKALTDPERHLLARLAAAGRPIALAAEDLALGKVLEERGLVLFVRDGAVAVIMPKGRHALTGEEEPKPGRKPRLDFL
jgi:hypothetical protein